MSTFSCESVIVGYILFVCSSDDFGKLLYEAALNSAPLVDPIIP